MLKPRGKKKGIKVVQPHQVGETDNFHALDNRRDYETDTPITLDPSPELLREFNEWYESKTGETLSVEEATQEIRNMVGFIETLHKWDIEDKKKKSENPA